MTAYEQPMHSEAGLFTRAGCALRAADATAKAELVASLLHDVRAGHCQRDAWASQIDVRFPGRPPGLKLVQPRQVPKRGVGSLAGRLALMHAVAHIEFNAINLALDAVQRFREMPDAYYADWLQVANEEVRHFALVRAYLQGHDADYGDYPAHDGLWQMAVDTADDVLERMAMVPRVLEARGLDVTPKLIHRFRQAKDREAADILTVIYEEELGHVAAGTQWFRHLCTKRGLEPVSTFFSLLSRHFPEGLHGPYNLPARRQAGFSEREIAILTEGL